MMPTSNCNDASFISAEIDRCAKDPWYFMTTYVMTSSPTTSTGCAPIHARPHQRITVERLFDERRLVVNKARQMGVSTVLNALALWGLMFGHKSLQGQLIVIVRTSLQSQLFKDAIVRQYNELPVWLRQVRETSKAQSAFSAGILRVRNRNVSTEDSNQSGEMTLVCASNHNTLKSLLCGMPQPGMILVDEAAYGNIMVSDVLSATRPTNDTIIAVASTPAINIGGGGSGDEFNKAVHALRRRPEQPVQNNDHQPIQFPESFTLAELPWYVDKDKDETWLQTTSRFLDVQSSRVELFCEPPI